MFNFDKKTRKKFKKLQEEHRNAKEVLGKKIQSLLKQNEKLFALLWAILTINDRKIIISVDVLNKFSLKSENIRHTMTNDKKYVILELVRQKEKDVIN